MNYNPVTFSRKDTQQFFQTARQRVNQYFEDNNIKKTGNFYMYLKTFVMYIIYLAPLVFMLLIPVSAPLVILLYLVMAIGKTGIGFSVMHDANHGSYSSKKWVNKLMGHSLDFIGVSSFTWHIQHNVKHHTYTNVYELDEDIHDKPFIRLSPYGKYKKYHRYQHIYALFLYSLATISWFVQKDFKQLVDYNRAGLTQSNGYNPAFEAVKMVLVKLFYIGYIIVLPILVGYSWWVILIGFLAMHLFTGFFVTVIFQLAHVVEGPDHFAPDPNGGKMDNTWAIHQLKTTANFSPKNRLITWYVGGLNFQVEHHLFPKVCHIHYPKIAKIVKETARECKLPYHEHPRFFQAVASHIKVLKDFGRMPVAATA